MPERTIVFWDREDAERLTHAAQDDAIESILDGMESIDSLPKTLEICGYARMELPKPESLSDCVLDHVLECLDEEHSNPEGDCTEATDTMKEAAKAFVAAVLDEYTPWNCEIVKRKNIDVMAWVEANRPDWLEGQTGYETGN